MKSTIFTLILTCLTLNVQAQVQQQTDSAPPPQGWIQADTVGISFQPGTFVSINTLPTLDTAWASAVPSIWSVRSGLFNWQNAPVNITDPWFTSGTYGFFLGGQGDVIFRTTNAGLTLDTLHTTMPYITSGYLLSPSSFYLVGLSWIGRTLDSGNTWNVQEINGNGLNAISFADKWDGYTVGQIVSGPNPNQRGGECFTTTDGGGIWTQVYTGANGDLWSVCAIKGQSVAYAGGDGGQIVKTTNGGNSWYPLDTKETGVIQEIDFPSPLHGIAVGGGGLIRVTNDSGHTWIRQNSNTKADLYSVKFYNDSIGIASGTGGTILITNNAGVSWVNQNPQPHDSLSVTAYPNPANAQTQFTYMLDKPEHMTLTIFSLTGETVASPLNYIYQSGAETVPLNTSVLAAGTYFYRLQSEDYSTQGSFTVVH
jgi:photosystem II stability/assembly factor-like uncharacterized protein